MKTVVRVILAAGLSAGFLSLFGAGGAFAQQVTGAATRAASAQASGASSSPHAIEEGDNEIGVWGGGSLHSPTLWGSSENANYGMVAVRYARVFTDGESWALKYTVDAVPVAALNYERIVFVPQPGAPGSFAVRTDRETVYGAGLAPIGFQLNLRRRERLQPFLQTSGGFLYFAADVPEARSSIAPGRHGGQFNFTTDFGGGVQLATGRRRALTLGYRFHHLSNGFRAPFNPGFDSNLFYAGFSFYK